MSVTVQVRPGVSREVEITLVRLSLNDTADMSVDRMFDESGQETFDPTLAAEVDCEGNLLELQSGDRITMRVDVPDLEI